MYLPYQAPAVDRAHRGQAASQQYVDPAFFSWDQIRGGLGQVADFLAPHAKTAAKGFASAVINDL